ncbi:uncharacterized protein PgNI_03798 [Pyricularia grisea]|uniref:DH domain-containing protein n=1 Tax=Pyricularia grisea TaxID=148305 RepID=A0A6P8BD39_PYRGI|nr:uncharacterized protein PgNI_03798 [Pyricularia grisea]TLD13738.1 hypothetical protein PgNI_03798 [Pyricularia grisea]
MVRVTDELALSPEHVTLYHTTDPLLGHLPVLVFHGPSTTANYTLNSSRLQIHVCSPAGVQSYPRITISPNSPFYAAVNYLPREFQGDEICRGLAFGIFKYFTELPQSVKAHLKNQYPTTRGRRPGSAPALFNEQHAADLAKAMAKAENTADTIHIFQAAFQTQHVSNVDVDLVLPPGAIVPLNPDDLEDVPEDEDDILDPTLRQYGMYTPLIKLFGEPVFLPTSKLRRAPSKPSSLNRGRSYTKDQKIELRMKMGELVDTEERYVVKLNELVNHIADDFRHSAKNRSAESLSPTEEEINRLFPRSAERILQINTGFMQALRKVMDDTEEDAINDAENTSMSSRAGGSIRVKDPSGALAMARTFLEWFPKFTDCYQEYIRASQNFPQLLNSFLDKESSFRQRVTQTGEQAVRSILIEPVQRLPRYSLFIDQIIGSLPITHPALQLMLRARDIITNICSMDEPLQDKPPVTHRLRNLVESWPIDLEPQGRLIMATDFLELAPPYNNTTETSLQDRAGIFLVFSDCIVMLKKKPNSTLKGRDLIREVDKPSPAGLLASMTNAAGGPGYYEIAFAGWHSIADVRFTESADNRMIWMTSTQEMKGSHAGGYASGKAVTSRCFLLQEQFEAKASRWSEDIVKSRIEARFPEKEREDPTWTLRSVRMPDNNLGLHAAVFQEGADQLIEGRREPAPIRIVLDTDKGTKSAPVGHYGVEILIEVKCRDGKSKVSMNTLGLNGKRFTDDIALEDFLPTVSRRIIQLLSQQFNVGNHFLAPALVSYYTKTLRGLSLSSRAEKTRSFLASSPVKLLSSFLGGSSISGESSGPSKLQKPQLLNSSSSSLFPPVLSRSNSSSTSRHEITSLSGSIRDKDAIKTDEDRPENPLVRLEQTFTGYVAVLQSRKGQFVGRTLLNRSSADELSINDLYNRLIESPFDWDASADLPSEVIFAAFEKFTRIAWRDQMGPIMTVQALDALQERAARRVPGDFADFVNYLFADMAPQNRRAFTALIKLLADLLDGCANDGDRGALTVAFAEVLALDGNPNVYINLLDRLVEDCDRIFEEIGFGSNPGFRGSAYESMNSMTRSQKSATGSLTSNTSSLRRKLGFDTLLRQNSSSKDSERPSMWRSLSKHGRHPATGESSSLSKASAGRARSIDMGMPSPNRLRRPGSRDRPPVAGAFDDIMTRPASSHRLETIGEPEVETIPERPLKIKRRSSLSDLKSLMAAASLEDTPPLPLRINKQTSEKFNSTTKLPTPSKIPVSPRTLQGAVMSPRQKENFAEPVLGLGLKSSLTSPPLEKPSHSKSMSTSQIPTLRITRNPAFGQSDLLGRSQTSPTKSSSTQKLRLQSPQKLRERLQSEKKAADDVDATLQSELSRITEDMARVNGSMPPRSDSTSMEVRRLQASIRALEERLYHATTESSQRHAAIERDMETTMKANEAKVRGIDQLYKESMAENELLYEKFNSELGKIVKALKGKGREDKEELVAKLKEQSEETARVKKENARLRRDIVSLRTLLKGGEN